MRVSFVNSIIPLSFILPSIFLPLFLLHSIYAEVVQWRGVKGLKISATKKKKKKTKAFQEMFKIKSLSS
jgi:hypothetical protein